MKPRWVLGDATGSTPKSTWRALARHSVGLANVRAFVLDEYLDASDGRPQSYRAVVDCEIAEPLGLIRSLVRTPGDDGEDTKASGRHERDIESAGGIDIRLENDRFFPALHQVRPQCIAQ